MAGSGNLVLRPWIRELILGSEILSSPQAGQLLKVLQDSETPGPSDAPDVHVSEVGAMLLVSDGFHSVRCLVTREALNSSDWEEKEFGFHGAEGRMLLLQVCEVRIQVAEGRTPAEFYLQVDRFNLLPTEQPRIHVTSCNQDSDVQKKLQDCLEDHLSESTSSSAGLTLSQLLDEVQEDQEHRGALVRLAESCLMLTGPGTPTSVTHWTASRCQSTGEPVYTVSSLLLHISENDQQILNSIDSSQKAPGTPASPRSIPLEESGASVSLLSALAAPDPGQRGSFQTSPTVYSPSPRPQAPSSPTQSCTLSTPFLSCTSSPIPLSLAPSPHQDHATGIQRRSLEIRMLGPPLKKRQLFPRTGAQEPCPVRDSLKRHHDGSAFQYKYEPPSASLRAQVQATRLPPQLVAWALHLVMEQESELT
uniref:Adrenocortical dysplasia n=2 Tax=Nannospalax galili TaxID=1026970 RepID=A0A8C6W1V3_NANGA